MYLKISDAELVPIAVLDAQRPGQMYLAIPLDVFASFPLAFRAVLVSVDGWLSYVGPPESAAVLAARGEGDG